MIKTDIIIIGAGPTGLFTVFEAGLLKLKCHLIDALAQPGGQCSEIYPKKPIYDIPAYPEILAGDLTDKLLEQCKQFEPGFTLGERAEEITKGDDGIFTVTTNKGTQHQAPVVAIAGGLGSFEPRKPQLENLEKFEDHGVQYIIKDPEIYRDKKVVIAGGGDSALDWSIFLANINAEVTLVHRRNEFRGALDSVEKVIELKKQTEIKKVILCSGKIYFDLIEAREKLKRNDVVFYRIEQLYPFPAKSLVKELKPYAKNAKFYWCQEEPKNMGAWFSVRDYIQWTLDSIKANNNTISYIGRSPDASPATGYVKRHISQQQEIIRKVFS